MNLILSVFILITSANAFAGLECNSISGSTPLIEVKVDSDKAGSYLATVSINGDEEVFTKLEWIHIYGHPYDGYTEHAYTDNNSFTLLREEYSTKEHTNWFLTISTRLMKKVPLNCKLDWD